MIRFSGIYILEVTNIRQKLPTNKIFDIPQNNASEDILSIILSSISGVNA